MSDMKEVLAILGVAPQRIHVEIFKQRVHYAWFVGAATRAPHTA